MNGNTEFTLEDAVNDATFAPQPTEETMVPVKAEKLVMDYSTDFPSLPIAPLTTAGKESNAWVKPAIRSSTVTEVIKLTAEERAGPAATKGTAIADERKKCKEIARKSGCVIDLSESRDGTLSIMITGKQQKVAAAEQMLNRELTAQMVREITIPKEHFGAIIGKEGSNLRRLQEEYNCTIAMPNKEAEHGTIKITGARAGADALSKKLTEMSSERSKQGNEAFDIPHLYYPWIRGASGVNYDRWANEDNVKVKIPPYNVENEKIIVTGEKDAVTKVANEIKAIYQEKSSTIKSLSVKIARSQIRFVLGRGGEGLNEILRNTDCVVEVPSEDSDSDDVIIYGTQSKVVEALSAVYARASSVISAEIPCPQWMHRTLTGPKRVHLVALIPNMERLSVDFTENGTIYLEGPPATLTVAKELLLAEIERLSRDNDSKTVTVPIDLHRHIVGKAGANITKLREEFDVSINMPNENTNSTQIVVEGKKEGVKKCIEQIKEAVKKLENEKSRDIIVEQRFHKNIIGSKGESVNKLRQQYPSVVVIVPDASAKSDIISIRGDKDEVDKVHAFISKQNKELLESNYQESVPIFKEFHKHIIGKGGVTINKIRDETTTRIELPIEGSGEEKILVTGKKENVKKAVTLLTNIQNEQANIITVETVIPAKAKARFAFNGRRLLSDIEKECGNVFFSIPKEKSDKITIRGPKEFVATAERLLNELLSNLNDQTEETTITAEQTYHKFLIGKAGGKVKKLREQYPTVRILFPEDASDDIYLVGKKEEVQAVKAILLKQIEELKQTIELTADVDSKYHKHFLVRGNEVLKDIQAQNGNVQVYFPKMGDTSTTVTIKGSKECAESAKARILEIVDDLTCQVTLEVEIDNKYYRTILANRGQHTQEISKQHNVHIKFPVKDAKDEVNEEGKNIANIVTIIGRDYKCEAAKNALLALVPIVKEFSVDKINHSALIGRGGEGIRALQQTYNVNISIPNNSDNSDIITITGVASNVDQCILELQGRNVEFEKLAEERVLKAFKIVVNVPATYHQKLIGRKGAVVNEMRNKFDVQISFPKEGDVPDAVTISGYEEKVGECKAEIEAIIAKLQSMFTQTVSFDPRFHPRMIGTGAKTLKKTCEEFNVDIRMPNKTDQDPTLVTFTGEKESDVVECIEALIIQEEDFVDALVDNGQYISARPEIAAPQQLPRNVQITGAPWQNNLEQFPTMGQTPPAPSSTVSGVWGSRINKTSC
uniref:Vigilin n=1 Tax=Rhabditophanes sp. KR3021 TaxID=114890 RepID=A0AC35TXN0_9BILA